MSILLYLVTIVLFGVFLSKKTIGIKISEDIIFILITLGTLLYPFNVDSFLTIHQKESLFLFILLSYVFKQIFALKVPLKLFIEDLSKSLVAVLVFIFSNFNFELKIILSISIYLCMSSKIKSEKKVFVSYLLISIMTVSHFIKDYFISPLSITNFIINDFLEISILATGILVLINLIIEIDRWYKNKSETFFNIYWPIIFILVSERIVLIDGIKDNYFNIIMFICIITLLQFRNRLYSLMILSGILSLFYIDPIYFIIPLVLGLLLSKRRNIGKIINWKLINISKYLDLFAVIVLITLFQFEMEKLGILAVVLFIYSFKKINERYVIE
jgi:hypothetical protein